MRAGSPITFPLPEDEELYFRNCSAEPVRDCTLNATNWNHDAVGCLQFCSWYEASQYITPKVRGRVALRGIVVV